MERSGLRRKYNLDRGQYYRRPAYDSLPQSHAIAQIEVFASLLWIGTRFPAGRMRNLRLIPPVRAHDDKILRYRKTWEMEGLTTFAIFYRQPQSPSNRVTGWPVASNITVAFIITVAVAVAVNDTLGTPENYAGDVLYLRVQHHHHDG